MAKTYRKCDYTGKKSFEECGKVKSQKGITKRKDRQKTRKYIYDAINSRFDDE